MAEELQKLNSLLSKKESISIEFSGKCNAEGILEGNLSRTVNLNPNVSHTIALRSFEAPSFFPNLTAKNNKFYYSSTGSTEEKEVALTTGAYDIDAYNAEIKVALTIKGDKADNITIELVKATGYVRIILKEGYKVYFNKHHTWRHCLSFEKVDLTSDGVHYSSRPCNVTPIQKIYVGCNLCKGSLTFEGQQTRGNILFSFANNKSYGVQISLQPSILSRRELLQKTFNSLRLEFFSDDKEPIDFNNSQVTGEVLIFQD